jgi:hypothetical protein
MMTEPSGDTKPQAGVMATSPDTAPDAAPSVVAWPSRSLSMMIQPSSAQAVAVLVFMNAMPASWPADSAEPALNPNQPNHSRPAPSSTNGTLCGRKLPPGQPRRRPRTSATATAAAPALACTTVPPAKSSAPRLYNHPVGEKTQCATGAYTKTDQQVMKTTKPPNRNRSALPPVINAGVMIANINWNAANTIGGMTCVNAPT